MDFVSSKKLLETWILMPKTFNREFRVEIFGYDQHGTFDYALNEKHGDGSFGHLLAPGGQTGGGPFKTPDEALAAAKTNIERLGPHRM
jgi:hypothetical protein